jgi:hypothetical protein
VALAAWTSRTEGGIGQHFGMWEGHSSTYNLDIEDGGRDQSVFSM